MIPRVVHFVFGLEEQRKPFHFLHYASLESCRQVLQPDAIYFHHKHLPWGSWWDRVRPHLTLVGVDHVNEVLAAGYLPGRVPAAYRYAHHADFIRLDVLIEHGGIYADIDTVFLRPLHDELFDQAFVIGREPDVPDEHTGELRASLCNALLMAEPNARFARVWRERMASALNGTWSNHSGFLSEELSRLMPSAVHLEPEVTFFPFPPTRVGLARLFEEHHSIPVAASSVHLWAHLWWDRGRRDFSDAHGGWCEPAFIRRSHSTFADIVRPYLPPTYTATPQAGSEADDPRRSTAQPSGDWTYVSMDDYSGYGVAADRCLATLRESGLEVKWVPVLTWDASKFEPPRGMPAGVVVAHLVPEYLPRVRKWVPDAFLVSHTVWETDRLPGHWLPCLEEADLLIVPSRFNANAFADAPVSAPVVVVPHVAPPIVNGRPEAWEWIPKDVFVFYTIAEWNERKAVFRTVEAYLRAFSGRDRVLLLIKTSQDDRRLGPSVGRGGAGKGTTAWALAQLLAAHRDPPPVRLITRELTHGEIAALHRRGDCFASLSRGEGWGLGAFDAAAYGNPVVTTGFGGHLDYLGDSPYLVGFELVPVREPAGVPSYAPDQRWADPDVDHGAALLREVAANRREASAYASAAAERIVWRYRPSAIAAAFRDAVDRVTSRDPRCRGARGIAEPHP